MELEADVCIEIRKPYRISLGVASVAPLPKFLIAGVFLIVVIGKLGFGGWTK